jgi:hypothetical protein
MLTTDDDQSPSLTTEPPMFDTLYSERHQQPQFHRRKLLITDVARELDSQDDEAPLQMPIGATNREPEPPLYDGGHREKGAVFGKHELLARPHTKKRQGQVWTQQSGKKASTCVHDLRRSSEILP